MEIKLLNTIDADEVSPVRRGANRKGVVLKEEGDAMALDSEVADILSVPWKHEGALLDFLRKEGVDETVQKSMIGGLRLLSGASEELPDEVRDLVEKLGSEMYARVNRPLNTSHGDGNGGELTGAADGDDDDAVVDGPEKDGSARGTSLTGHATAANLNKSDDEDGDAVENLDSAIRRLVAKAMRRKPQDGKPDPEENGDDGDADDNAVNKGGTVDSHVAVPIKKEDGSWDYSGVPAEAVDFYRATVEKADAAEARLVAAEERIAKAEDDKLTRTVIAKADTLSLVGSPEELADVLKAAHEHLEPEQVEKLEAILTGANERIQKGDLFKEHGAKHIVGQESPGDAWSKIEKMAEDLVEKSEGMTQDKAVDIVLKTNEGKRLYEEYSAQQLAAGMGGMV